MYAVILAGGRGTRFWPLSRKRLPKQCLALDGGPTLIQATLQRLLPDIPPERVLVITGPDMVEAIAAQLPQLPPANLLVEPSGRNTAPCIAWACWEVARRGGDHFVVLPADHHIGNEAAFRAALREAAGIAMSGALVTLGIRPTRPETGFGWIEPGDADRLGGLPVRRFVEKPPRAVAERLLQERRCLWNAGMFVWRTDVLRQNIRSFLKGCEAFIERLEEGAALADVWGLTEATSVDYGILEHAAGVRTLPVDFGWSDVGSWPVLAELLPDQGWGSGVAEPVVAVEARGNLLHAPGKLVALLGVENLVVVDRPDVLLVADKSRSQDVRALIEELERRGLSLYT